MRWFVFIGWFSKGFALKSWAFPQTRRIKNNKKLFFLGGARALRLGRRISRVNAKIVLFSTVLHTRTHNDTPGARTTKFQCVFASIFFCCWSFWVFSSLKLVLRLGIEFLYFVISSEASWIFIHCLSKSSRDDLLCRFTWFCTELHQKHLNLFGFRKTRITLLEMKILQNVM